MMRESSPPDAMRASGRSSSPGLGETRNSAVSMPRARPRGLGELVVVEADVEPGAAHRELGKRRLERRANRDGGRPPRRRECARARRR